MQITQLWRYPVKSMRGRAAESLDLEPWGPAGDRRWAVVDGRGRKLTARVVHELLRIDADLDGRGGIELRHDAGEAVFVPEPHDGEEIEVNISRLPTAVDAGDDAAAFLRHVLGREARLVWQPDPRARSVDPVHGGQPGELLTLADAGPLLLTSEASLARLQTWIGTEPRMAMSRFRPNVVIDGGQPFAEDGWTSVVLGESTFRVQAPCDRCVMTTIDPVTLEAGPEPLRALDAHHSWDRKPYFGIWLVPAGTGRIEVGDPVAPAPASGGVTSD